jgi:hypothetical protein
MLRSRLDDNVKIGLTEVGCEDGRWIELAQSLQVLVSSALNLHTLITET